MAFNFPNSPVIGDTVTNGPVTYRWDGTKWVVIGSSGGGSGGGGSYSLPIASTTVLGGIKSDGTTTTVGPGGVLTANQFTLPIASSSVLGGVKPDNTTILIDGSGVIRASVSTTYTLPQASTTVLGGIKPDGTTVSVDGSGVLHSNTSYTLPTASPTVLGGVKPDNTTVFITSGGVLSAGAGAYTLPAATTTVLGGVKPDGSSITVSGGVISAKGAAGLNPPSVANTLTSTPDPADMLMIWSTAAAGVFWLPISTASDGIGDLPSAAPVTAGTQFWANQAGAADVSVTGQQIADFARSSSLATVPLTRDTTLNYAQHNGHRLYATVDNITVSAPSGAGALQDGFNTILTNISGANTTLAASITLLPGTAPVMLPGTQVDISATTAGGTGTVVYAASRGAGGGGSTAAPNTPTSLVLSTHAPTQLQVTWITPTGPVPTSYTLQYQVSGAGSWTSVSGIGPTNYTINGLVASTAYLIEVAAANALGSSPFTAPLAVSTDATLAAPGVPTSLVNSARASTSLTITWSPPASGGAVATYNPTYVLHSGGTPTVVSVPGTQFSYTFTGLTAATAYDLSVTSTNATSTSSAASLANISTLNLPAQVSGLSHTAETSTSVTLAWSAASGATSYHIQYRVNSPVGAWQDRGSEPSTLSAIVTGLVSSQTYDFQVAGKNSDGIGTYSSTVTDTTTAAATATVTAPTLDATGSIMASVAAANVVVTFANTSTVYAVPWTGSADVGTRIAVTVSGSTVAGLIFSAAIATAIATIRVYAASTGGVPLAECSAFKVAPYTATQIFNTAGTYTFNPPLIGDPGYAPAGTQVTFECTGGGSGGNLNGGAGGAYSKQVHALTTAEVASGITLVVGAGTAGVTNGTVCAAGGTTTVTGSAGTICSAQGGHQNNAGASNAGGGLASASIGTVKFNGGPGNNSGGGGGAGGPDGAGIGSPGNLGGDGDNHLGGAGGGSTTLGSPGASNIKGGGGGSRSTSTAQTGGDGGAPGAGGGGCTAVGGVGGDAGAGQIIITYTPS